MISSINTLILSANSGGFSECSRRILKILMKYSKEYWYIGSIKDKSAMAKNNLDPRLAIDL